LKETFLEAMYGGVRKGVFRVKNVSFPLNVASKNHAFYKAYMKKGDAPVKKENA